ncbi:MAG: hypothetical protein ACRCZM_05895 [Bacteroidales bacterium]
MNELITPRATRLSNKRYAGRRVKVGDIIDKNITIKEVEITRSKRAPNNELLLMQLVVDQQLLFCWSEATLLISTIKKALGKRINPPYATRIKQNKTGLYMFVKTK